MTAKQKRLEVLPCPFCRKRAGFKVVDPSTPEMYVGCFNLRCWANGPRRKTIDSAVRAWNKVPRPDK